MARDVLFLVYPGAQPIDLSGPFQAFTTAEEEAGGGVYRLRVASMTPGSVSLAGGLPIVAGPVPRSSPHTLIVPGGPGVHAARTSDPLLRTLLRLAGGASRVCSVCTGAFLLAAVGLLEGRRVTTHWRSCGRLAEEFPILKVEADPIWVRDGPVWTSAGVTAGIDLALALIEEDLGAPMAARVARRLVVYVRRPGGQAQYSAPLAMQENESFAPLMAWLGENLHRDLGSEDLAERAGMAPRTFHRRFLAATGTTPAKAIARLRLDRARVLMETTRLSLLAVAGRSGFGSEERLRRAFLRSHGITPSEWRERFAPQP
jgi:transcriptional regulator GlxA family with amidase domain